MIEPADSAKTLRNLNIGMSKAVKITFMAREGRQGHRKILLKSIDELFLKVSKLCILFSKNVTLVIKYEIEI